MKVYLRFLIAIIFVFTATIIISQSLPSTYAAGIQDDVISSELPGISPKQHEKSSINSVDGESLIFLPVIFNNFCLDFLDDFSNSTTGWSVGENDLVRFEYLNGEYRVLSKEAGFIYLFRAPTCSRQNYVVETDARWVGTPGGSYGLIFGITDSPGSFFNQYYLFDMNTDFQSFRLYRRNTDGSFTTVAPITFSSAIKSGNAANHLKVTRNGDQITLEVNGIVLGTWTDDVIIGLTDVGLVASPYSNMPTSDARFDNYVVNSLPGSTTSQSSPERPFIEANDETVICAPVSWTDVPGANMSGQCSPGWINDGSH